MGGSCFEQLGEAPSEADRELAELDNFYPVQTARRGPAWRPAAGAGAAATAQLFVLGGKGWPTAEHYYQAMKFPHNAALQERIRAAPLCTGGEDACYSLGHSEPPRRDWEAVKVDTMYAANLAKFQQNPALRDLLVATRGRIRARGAAGGSGAGWATWNEVLLERIREELRAEAGDSAVLARRVAIMDAYRAAAEQSLLSPDSVCAARQVTAIAKHAVRRELAPDALEGGRPARSIKIAGFDGLDAGTDRWVCGGKEMTADLSDDNPDGEYFMDPLQPLVNGQPHFMAGSCTEGTDDCMHLYLGAKRDERRWVLDTSLDAGEVGGTLTLPAEMDARGEPIFPAGTHSWQVYSGVRVDLAITVRES